MRPASLALDVAMAALGALALGCQTEAMGTGDVDGGAKPECVSCHMPEYAQVKEPLHEGKKPTKCGVCHSQNGWRPSRVDHPWPLTGKHEKADCFACHTGNPPVFKNTGKACYDCHAKEYDKPPFADHLLLQKACADCHTTTDWKTLVPHPIWPPDDAPSGDAGAPHDAAQDAHEAHEADAGVKRKPKPAPTAHPTTHPTSLPPPDVTTHGSRRVHK